MIFYYSDLYIAGWAVFVLSAGLYMITSIALLAGAQVDPLGKHRRSFINVGTMSGIGILVGLTLIAIGSEFGPRL
jgi:hypothetical protein